MSNADVSGLLSKTMDDSARGDIAKSAVLSHVRHKTTLNNTSGVTLYNATAVPSREVHHLSGD